MSEALLNQDIQRVRRRIARLRKRTGRHALRIGEMPAIQTFKSYQSLGQSWFAAKPASQPPPSTGWWSLLIVIAGWYFSQPEAARKLGHKLFAYWRAWRDSADATNESEEPEGDAETSQPS